MYLDLLLGMTPILSSLKTKKITLSCSYSCDMEKFCSDIIFNVPWSFLDKELGIKETHKGGMWKPPKILGEFWGNKGCWSHKKMINPKNNYYYIKTKN